jgi:hypothetical protein
MIEARQDSPLSLKAPQNFVRIGASLKELDRDFFLELSVRSVCQVDSAHSTPAKLTNNLIGSNPSPGRLWRRRPRECHRGVIREIVKASGRLRQERFNFLH